VIAVGDPAPSFALPDTYGRIRTSQEFLGAPLVVVLTRHVH
jgi:peroxiredoxin